MTPRPRAGRFVVGALVAVGVVAVLVAALLGGLATRGSTPSAGPSAGSTATRAPAALTAEQAGASFLHRYVRDGRVVRTDQGGDTVSEGQAYAMLVAVGVHDRAAFTAVWTWTRQHLQRPDGLLSWRWTNGAVTDQASASDADLDAARALVLAGRAFADPRFTADGTALGSAVLDHETVVTAAGRILVAGNWATTEPYSYNPSYYSSVADAVLAAASSDPRWAELAEGSRAVTATLLRSAPLPPDWAQVHANGTVDAMPGALGQGQSVRFGYDATRTVVWLAESCEPADRALAAATSAPLDRGGDAAELDLGGSPLGGTRSVVAAVAHAAAAAVDGDTAQARRSLLTADQLEQRDPTYYGAAWDALGRLELTRDVLGGCPPLQPAA